MTLPTLKTARDEIRDLFWQAWKVKTPALNGGAVVPVEWQKVVGDPPDASKPFARHTINHQTGGQQTFGATGQRRFIRMGFLTVQIFTPLANAGGLSLDDDLAIIARDAYEGVGTASGIWFRNVRIQEVGADGAGRYQTHVVADFEYEEQR